MSDADIRKRAEEIVSTWVSPQASTFNRDVDLVLAFADERVKAERELQESTVVSLNRECDDLNNKVVEQIAVINDIAMMGRRLSYALKRSGTNDALVTQCVQLFKKHDLGGNIVRAEAIERGTEGK